MTATTEGRNTGTRLDSALVVYPVAASTSIYNGTLVCINSSGYLVNASDTAGLKFVGVAQEDVDNSAGANGAKSANVRRKGIFSFVSSGLAVTDQMADLWVADNQTVQKTPANVYCGKLSAYTSASVADVMIDGATLEPPSGDEDYFDYPVAATTTITAGNMVCIGATGYLTNAADTRGLKLVGIAAETVDNSAGADGDLSCMVKRGGVHNLTGAGLTVADAGKPVWVGASATAVTTTPSNVFAGILARYSSATVAPVDIDPAAGDMFSNPDLQTLPVAASTTITSGTMVCINSSGYLIAGTTTAGIKFAGVALETIDNSAGANGALSCRVIRRGIFEFTAAGLAITDYGAEVWISNATTVTTTPGNVRVGKLSRYDSATVAPVAIDPDWEGRIFTIDGSYIGAVGSSGVKGIEDREFTRKYKVLSGWADAQTAPSSTYSCGIVLSDGVTSFTVTISTTATHGENKTAGTVPMLAATDTDVTLTDDNASATTADVKFTFVCQEL